MARATGYGRTRARCLPRCFGRMVVPAAATVQPARAALDFGARAPLRIVWRTAVAPLWLEQSPQPLECFIPLGGNLVQVTARFVEPLLLQLPHPFPSAARTSYQACMLHHAEVLGHRLPRNPRARR